MSTDFKATRALFDLPDGLIYLDGNSLGPLPHAAKARVAKAVSDEWGEMLIGGWNTAGWMDMPQHLGNRIAPLIGAEQDTVLVGDTLSIRVYQCLAAALDLVADRKVILSDRGNFPTDLYMAEGLINTLERGHELRLVDPDAVADHLTDDVAVLMLTEVDYRTGRKHDMAALTKQAQAKGIVTFWDLAHSAGALPVDLRACNVDFAAGCTYKYLNAGPGAPAFAYVAPKWAESVKPALPGWLGHAAPFAFETEYRPAHGAARMRVGTPPVLQMAALDAALDVWDQVDLQSVREQSLALTDAFMDLVATSCPSLTCITPSDHAQRGSQVSFRHPDGYAIMQALIARGVIGDFRAPDILRFGITPLYISDRDIERAVAILADILKNTLWDRPEYHQRAQVT